MAFFYWLLYIRFGGLGINTNGNVDNKTINTTRPQHPDYGGINRKMSEIYCLWFQKTNTYFWFKITFVFLWILLYQFKMFSDNSGVCGWLYEFVFIVTALSCTTQCGIQLRNIPIHMTMKAMLSMCKFTLWKIIKWRIITDFECLSVNLSSQKTANKFQISLLWLVGCVCNEFIFIYLCFWGRYCYFALK